MPGKRGITAHCNPICLISALACSAPPPPNGMAANFAGSCPRSIETSRMAPAMRASATRTIASAAASTSRPSGPADMRGDGRARRRHVEPGLADRPLGIDAAEHDLGVRQRRPRIAAAVAGRSRHRAGAIRSDLQEPAAIDRGDRAAAGADGGDLHHRGADHQAEIDRGLGGERGPAAGHDRDVERGAAEIAGDDVVVAGGARDRGAGDDAGGRAGQRGAHRQPTRGFGRHHAAVRLHDVELPGEALLGERAVETRRDRRRPPAADRR